MAEGKTKAPRLQVDVAEDANAQQSAPREAAASEAADELTTAAAPSANAVEEEAAPLGASAEPAATEAAPSSRLSAAASWLSRMFPGNEHAVVGGLAGLLVAVMMFVAGFWKTLFVVCMIVVGVTVGQCLDGNPKIIEFVRRVIRELRSE